MFIRGKVSKLKKPNRCFFPCFFLPLFVCGNIFMFRDYIQVLPTAQLFERER